MINYLFKKKYNYKNNMSNINNLDNINPPNQNIEKSIKNQILNFISSIPFCIRFLLSINLIFYIFSFSITFSFYLANIPYYTILRFQIWRLITANLLSTGLLNIIFAIFFWLPQSINLERSIGTVRYMMNFFVNSFFIQFLYSLFLVILSIIFKTSILLKKIHYDTRSNMYFIESDGLWPYIMMEMTILCLVNPEKDINVLCFFSSIKSKYYPIVLLVVLSFINCSIRLDLFAGVAYGFIYSYYLKNFLDFNEQTIEKLEDSFLFNYVKDYPSFIKKSKIDASLLLGSNMNNDNNYNNYNNNLNNNILRFTPFTGNSVQVGGN